MSYVKLISCMSVLCIFINGIWTAATSKANTEKDYEYYWQEYTGTIPEDAVPGGKRNDGSTTYIGQTYFSTDVLLPGELDGSTNALNYAMNGGAFTTHKNIKILCSPHPENFEWFLTDTRSVRFLTEKHLVQGGFDDDYPLLIGRQIQNTEIVVGKVTINKQYESIAFAANGTATYNKSDFEVLSYNANIPASSLPTEQVKKIVVIVDPINKTAVVESGCASQVKIINIF